MERYKIAFCGLGSIGKRHLQNTVRYLQEHHYAYQIDAVRSGAGTALPENIACYISQEYSCEDELPADYDIMFITNPTSMHREYIERYCTNTKSMFIEKPLVDDISRHLDKLPSKLVCYVACPLRYTRTLQYVKEHIDCSQAYSVRAVCSTYLPGWHPHEDYRKSYSAHKSMGGGVSIDLIHEWDYLIWLFGRPDSVTGISRKISELEIDSEDIAVYIGYTDKLVYELHLDYFGREEKRNFEIYLPGETITVDLRGGNICFSDGKKISLYEERDEYQMREIAHFFDIIRGVCENDNNIDDALNTLKTAKGISDSLTR
jgi:predicted dehydrogenase